MRAEKRVKCAIEGRKKGMTERNDAPKAAYASERPMKTKQKEKFKKQRIALRPSKNP